MTKRRPLLLLFTFSMLFGCNSNDLPTSSHTQEWVIVDQIESLSPRQYINYAFTVDPNEMANPFLQANMTASGGLVSAINILVLTDHQFDRWRAVNNVQYTPIAETGFLREAKLAISLPDPGIYRLVLSNKTSDESLKINITAKLNFEKP